MVIIDVILLFLFKELKHQYFQNQQKGNKRKENKKIINPPTATVSYENTKKMKNKTKLLKQHHL